MKAEEFWDKLYLFVQPLVSTGTIVILITMLWMYLEEIYLGYINQNPVASVITMIYSGFVYLWVKDKYKKELGK